MTKNYEWANEEGTIDYSVDLENEILTVKNKISGTHKAAFILDFKDILLTDGKNKFHVRVYDVSKQKGDMVVGMPKYDSPYWGRPVYIKRQKVGSFRKAPIKMEFWKVIQPNMVTTNEYTVNDTEARTLANCS